jgi:hypothetical protein
MRLNILWCGKKALPDKQNKKKKFERKKVSDRRRRRRKNARVSFDPKPGTAVCLVMFKRKYENVPPQRRRKVGPACHYVHGIVGTS